MRRRERSSRDPRHHGHSANDFQSPMSTVQLQQPAGTGQGGRQIREEIDDLLRDLASAPHRDGARELGDLLHQRPAGTQVVMEARW